MAEAPLKARLVALLALKQAGEGDDELGDLVADEPDAKAKKRLMAALDR